MYPGHDRNQELRQANGLPSDPSGRFAQFLDTAIAELKDASMADVPRNDLVPPPLPATDVLRRNLTGASELGADLKATIAAAKAKVTAAREQVAQASVNIADAANQAVKVAAALNDEAADLLASIGQNSNMPPE